MAFTLKPKETPGKGQLQFCQGGILKSRGCVDHPLPLHTACMPPPPTAHGEEPSLAQSTATQLSSFQFSSFQFSSTHLPC
jgi:hypothetical protein